MKIVWTFTAILCVGLVDAAGKIVPDSPAQFTAKVVDEEGKPLEGMTIEGGIESEEPPQEGKTDRDGLFVFQCQKALMGAGGFVVNHNVAGYYESHAGLFFRGVENERWVPWNPVITTVVKRVINPIPMYAKKVETQIMATNALCGFDLMIGDWVQPAGKGVRSDLVFKVAGYWTDYRDNDSTLTITFSVAQDGLVRVDYPVNSGSTLVLPRSAPERNYQSELKLRKYRTRGLEGTRDVKGSDIREGRGYLFRIRSATNEFGRITNALYGKIARDFEFGGASSNGCFLKFIYYLNPTPNDRNLEFDPQRNLFKDLKSTEEVTEP